MSTKKRKRRENRAVAEHSQPVEEISLDSGDLSPYRTPTSVRDLPPLHRYAIVLSRGSLFARTLRRLGFSYDDKTQTLATSPLGMFFYNQRFLFFAVGFLYIICLQVAAVTSRTPQSRTTVWLVFAFWLVAILITFALHNRFIRNVAIYLQQSSAADFPPVFYPYVLLDSALVLLLVLTGTYYQVDLHYFAFLLLANTIVYCACAGAHVGSWKADARIPVLLCIFVIALFVGTRTMQRGTFIALRDIGPVLGMSVVAVMAVAVISAVRQREQALMHSQVAMLERLEETLGGAGITHARGGDDTPKDHFERRLRRALRVLTPGDHPFWYRAARIWFVDERFGEDAYLLPGPFHGVKEFVADPEKLRVSPELLASKDIHIVPTSQNLATLPEPIRNAPDVSGQSTAYVPIIVSSRLAAIITFYGVPDDPAVVHHQKPFLRSVAAIIADTFEQADVRHASRAQEAIDELFRADALTDVLPRAARVLATSTRAEGCIIAVRSDTDPSVLQVAAAHGFHSSARDVTFSGDAIARIITDETLWSAYDGEINAATRERLNVLHGRPIQACLGVPFSSFSHPYGVILLVNSAGRAPWFSRTDVDLVKRLAHTIGRLVDKFRQIESTQHSLQLARDNAEKARIAQHNAETAALQRQEDIMVITHQLQAPLASIRASVLRLQRKLAQPQYQRHLEHIQGLIEDSLALCWGTVTTFAAEAGRATSFEVREIDAPAEMERLAKRMQKTNARDDLDFEFVADEGFPTIRIDRAAFTSVFYSLIHNAMKYAERHSRVVMECGFERSTGQAVLKVKSLGEPIEPSEKELIFRKYRRGHVVTTTGRHHAGVGLGLWVAKQLIEAVGGEISVELTPTLPRLSVFIVRYPIVTSGGAIAESRRPVG